MESFFFCEPEYAHPGWNNFLMAIDKAGLQPTLLVTTLMTHVNHGSYGLGRNLELKREVCAQWVGSVEPDEFEGLREAIASDCCTDVGSDVIPSSKEQLLDEPIASSGMFVH